jgi:hypothetical protein
MRKSLKAMSAPNMGMYGKRIYHSTVGAVKIANWVSSLSHFFFPGLTTAAALLINYLLLKAPDSRIEAGRLANWN